MCRPTPPSARQYGKPLRRGIFSYNDHQGRQPLHICDGYTIFATDTQDIVEFRPRTVSRELFDAEAKLWADWHVSQSQEEAQYPNL